LVTALGLIPFSSEKIPLGLEFAGVIRQIGSQVKDVSVGDRVFGFAAGGLFSSNAILPSLGVVKIPDQLSFEDAATMPVCFVTVMRALFEVGNLERDQVSEA
jgi:NADPH:quinone reductase-like Zn-dependent oxidoreductase